MRTVRVTSAEIAALLGSTTRGGIEVVDSIAALDDPKDGALTFAVDPQSDLLERWAGYRGIVITTPESVVPNSCVHVLSYNPRGDFAKAVIAFFAPTPEVGIAASAVIHPTAVLGREVFIGHNAVVEAGVVIGERSTVGNNSTILRDCHIGNGVSIGHNTVVGSIGFGLEEDDDGKWVRIPHLGRVVIEDGVEIGSSSVIARGTIKETHVGANCKIDDNVFIAHNVFIDENSVVIANAEISGSVQIGKNCWIGPSVTVIEKVRIGDGAFIGIGSVVIRDVPAGKVVVGNPGKVLRDR